MGGWCSVLKKFFFSIFCHLKFSVPNYLQVVVGLDKWVCVCVCVVGGQRRILPLPSAVGARDGKSRFNDMGMDIYGLLLFKNKK